MHGDVTRTSVLCVYIITASHADVRATSHTDCDLGPDAQHVGRR